jgi:hypothetical protein
MSKNKSSISNLACKKNTHFLKGVFFYKKYPFFILKKLHERAEKTNSGKQYMNKMKSSTKKYDPLTKKEPSRTCGSEEYNR